MFDRFFASFSTISSFCFTVLFSTHVCLFSAIGAFGNTQQDSLRNLLYENPDSPALLNHLASLLIPDSIPEGRAFAQKALLFAQESENLEEQARACYIIGDSWWYANDFEEAARWFGKSARSYHKANDLLMAANGYNDMAFAWNQIDRYPEAIEAYRKSMNILLDIGDNENLPAVLINIGQVHQRLGSIDSAIFYNKQAVALSNVPGNEENYSAALSNLGYIYKNIGDFDNALSYYQQAFAISKKMNQESWMSSDLNNIANVYTLWQKYDLAKAYLRESIRLSKKMNDRSGMEINLNNLAYTYQQCNDLDSAMILYKQSAEIARDLGKVGNLAIRNINIGILHLLLGNYDTAARYVESGLETNRKLGLKHSVSGALQSMGMIAMAQKDYAKSKAYFDEALSLALELDARITLEKIYEGRSKLFTKMGNYRLALEDYRKFVAIKDSIFNKNSQEKLAEMQARYETEKKQQKIELLIKDNELQKTELDKKQITLLALGGGSAILAISALIIWFLYLQKARANRKLVEKNLEMMKKEDAENSAAKVIDKHSPLPDNEKSKMIEALEDLMLEKQMYRQKQITLADLAGLLQTNTSYLSRIINEHYGVNFSNFLNAYRIKEAQKMFTKNQHQAMTLEGIAETIGFQTRSTFNIAFKKFTGVTPTVFIKNIKQIKQGQQESVYD